MIATENGQLPTPEKLPPATPPPADAKFTEDTRRKVLVALQNHHFMSSAAALAGVSVKSVYVWLQQGAKDLNDGIESDFAQFNSDVELAIATSEGRALKVVTAAAERGSTKDAQWILERRHSDRWAKRDKVEVGGDPNQPIVVQLTWPGAAVDDADSELALPAGTTTPPILDAEIVDGDD